jgi:hypothetical protein
MVTPLVIDGKLNLDAVISRADLVPFAEFVSENKPQLENVFDRQVREDVRTKPTRQLNDFLATMGLKLVNAGTRRSEGDKVYDYRLDPERIEIMQSVVDDRVAAKGWEWLAQQNGWPPQRSSKTRRFSSDDYEEDDDDI